MTGKRPFFLNAFPPHDRRERFDTTADLLRLGAEAKSGLFAHTLFTVGLKRLDPWVLAQRAMGSERELRPLIAVNPLLQKPQCVAGALSALADLYQRPLAVNLIAGSFYREHLALGDERSFQEKGEALRKFYHELKSLMDPGIDLRYFVSGYGHEDFAREEDTFTVKSLRPLPLEEKLGPRCGYLVGLCARETQEEARTAVRDLFPEDRYGKWMREMGQGNEMTPWNSFLREMARKGVNDHYHLGPLESFWSPAPFVVGSYDDVAGVLSEYVKSGAGFFIVDFHPKDFSHVAEVLGRLLS